MNIIAVGKKNDIMRQSKDGRRKPGASRQIRDRENCKLKREATKVVPRQIPVLK